MSLPKPAASPLTTIPEVMTTPYPKLLRFPQLGERGITFTRRHLYTLEAERKFPRRVSLGENSVGWVEIEIDNWLRGKIADRAA